MNFLTEPNDVLDSFGFAIVCGALTFLAGMLAGFAALWIAVGGA